MSIELWAARLERPLTAEEAETMMGLLPPERRERLLLVRQEERRQEPLCAYFILRQALKERCGWRELPEIALTSRGKPYFPHHPEVQFNLSHTAGAVLVGISDEPLGVDIEHIRPVSQRAMRRLADVDTREDFFRSWVRREARAKRSGDGVGTMMWGETPLRYGEVYYEIETFPGYAAGVATGSAERSGTVRRLVLGGARENVPEQTLDEAPGEASEEAR